MIRITKRVRIPVVLAAVLALDGFLNLAVGLAAVFGIARYVGDVPEYLRVSSLKTTSAALSILLGAVLIILGKGLYDRRRASWAGAVGVTAVLMTNNLLRGTTPATAILSGSILVALLVFRRQFDVRGSASLGYAQVVALISVAFALAYGIVGSYLLRSELNGIETWTDCIYFTIVTYSTVGYGDIIPASPAAKTLVMTMIPLGLTSFVTAVTALVGPAIEKRMKGVLSLMQKLRHTEDHTIVCGYTSVSETVVQELQKRGKPYVIIEDREGLVAALRGKGHDVIAGDPSRRETLDNANFRRAAALISAFDSDAVNILVAVTARELRDTLDMKPADPRIVVRVEDEENVAKAKQVGADEVISPSSMGGRLMVERAVAGGGDDEMA